MTLFPINTKEKDKKIPITKICVTFKLVNFRPCSVDIIFHIDKMQVKKNDEINKNIAKDLNFICFFSNQSKINNHKRDK